MAKKASAKKAAPAPKPSMKDALTRDVVIVERGPATLAQIQQSFIGKTKTLDAFRAEIGWK